MHGIHKNRTGAIVMLSILTGPGLLLAADKMDFSKLDLSKLPKPAEKKDITFAKDIQPLFDASCVRCHGDDWPKAGLRLNSMDGVLHGSKDGKVLTPGDSAKSLIVIAAAQIDEHSAMPPKRGPGRGGPHGGPGGPPGSGGPGNPGGPPNPAGPGSFNNGPNGGPNSDHGSGPPPGPRGGPGAFGPPPKPLTAEQVGLLRAWIDQGAK